MGDSSDPSAPRIEYRYLELLFWSEAVMSELATTVAFLSLLIDTVRLPPVWICDERNGDDGNDGERPALEHRGESNDAEDDCDRAMVACTSPKGD